MLDVAGGAEHRGDGVARLAGIALTQRYAHVVHAARGCGAADRHRLANGMLQHAPDRDDDIDVFSDEQIDWEGYIDERGLVEPEGPYGEYIGYYGLLKSNPVFHLTAITKRRDALFQTVTIGGARLTFTDTAQLGAAKTEGKAAGKPGSSVSSAAASRRRVPITLPTSSVFSGPTARNQTAWGLQSRTAATSIRSIGSSWTTHSPCCASFSTKWRKRNFSVSVMKMLSSRSHAWCQRS
jgi:3-octaprenyl-4-hydroxybenzoate carboxy-lyase